MATDRELLRRIAVGTGIAAVFLVVAYAFYVFVAAFVFAVFLYYAVRPIFRVLSRFRLHRRLRAALAIILFGLPFLILIAYSVAIVAAEIQTFLGEQDLTVDGTEQLISELNIAGLDLEALQGLAGGDTQLSFDIVADSLFSAVSIVGSVFVQLLLVVFAAYYMLVDGPRLVKWLLDTYDRSGIGRQYVRAVDSELSLALFGNIVNIFFTAIITIGTFYAYNVFAAPTVSVPFPALLGALTGIASLIPVVGIKLVYVPLCFGLGANAILAEEPELLVTVLALLLVSALIVDLVPDFVIRAQVSSEDTHSGLLLIAYIVGPSVFGFYGLFLAPIVLVCATNAVKILLPYTITGRADPNQLTIDRFEADVESPDHADGEPESADDPNYA